MMKRILLLLFLVSCAGPAQRYVAQESTKEAFDEVYGTTQGERVRLVYEGIVEHYQNLSEDERAQLAKATLKDFDGDNALLPLPRVLTETEFDGLSSGVDQRGRAIREFLKDHYSGKKKYLKEGIIPQAVIERIIKRAGEEDWEGVVRADNLNFWYGPDVIRGPPVPGFPEGQFLVVEDNPSFIGGMGDLIRAREILDRYMPAYSRETGSRKPDKFYKKLMEDYKKRAKEYKGKAVAVQYITSLTADNEEKRIRAIMEEAGIEVVFINPYSKNNGFKKNGKRLVVKNGQLVLETKQKTGRVTSDKVGYVIANMNPQDLELSHPANRKYHILTEAAWELEQPKINKSYKAELESLLKPDGGEIDYDKIVETIEKRSPFKTTLNQKLGVPGLTDLVAKGKVGMTNGAGMEFVGDKEFYIYIEELIRFYLNEEPVLKNMDTGSFAKFTDDGAEVLDDEALERIFKNKKGFVVKDVIGRGGDAVWVGPKVEDEVWEKVKQLVRDNPGRYIFQEFNPLSTLEGFIGDIRLISDVHMKGVRVANIPWARVVSMEGDGKVNISANGFEATVLVRKLTNMGSCYQLMRPLLK
jgi:uncharacterized circularly permuted ATP-grasp superfamily protein